MKNIVSYSIPAALAMGLLGSASALAQDASTMYAGISYSQIDFDEIDEKPAMVVGIVGWPVGENFSIEGRFGAGVKSVKDAEFINGRLVTAELKVNNYYGGFVRGTLPAGDAFNLYAILGYGSGKAEVTTNVGVSASDSESSEAYGVGAEFVFGQSKTNHLAFEWARYFEDTNAISVIYRLKF
jgi:hypothetical protein